MNDQSTIPALLDTDVRLELFERIVADAKNGIVITDADASICYVNAAFTSITGFRREHVIGNNMRTLHSGRQDEHFYRAMWHSLIEDGHWEGEIWNRRRNGECYEEWLSINALKDEQDATSFYVGIFSDISSIKSKEHQLERLAFCEPLTRLPNQLLFRDRLKHSLACAKRLNKPLTLLILDLDGFKQLNEVHSDMTGDRALQEFSDRLRDAVREADTIAHMGSDEFALLLWDVASGETTESIAHRVIGTTEKPLTGDKRSVMLSTSVGISHYPEDGEDGETLTQHATLAMYGAKKKGGNRYQSYRTLHERIG